MEKFHFIILLISYKISSKHIINSQAIPQADIFYIDGTKNAKASFWSLNIKLFVLTFILLNKMNYMLLFKLFSYILTPLIIVSDSLYSAFVLKNIETSTINSNQPIIQQLFFELQSIIRNCTSPIYILRIQTHSYLPGTMIHGNQQADKHFFCYFRGTTCSITQ